MNPIVLSFVDGTTFFIGLIVVLVAELLLFCIHRGCIRSVLPMLILLGMILVVASATPLPIWAYIIWFVPVVTILVLNKRVMLSNPLLFIAVCFLCVATSGLILAEAPYHYLPQVIVPKGRTVYVLGDSISAGMGTKHRCWPTVFSEITSLKTVNLSQPGATIEGAITQAEGILESNSVIVIEIGGNDILAFGTDAGSFIKHLDVLVSLLRSKQHQVLMVELPLFPFQNSFGMAQRSIAVKYNVAMLPKRCFTEVLSTKNGTLDGLHLSQEGHDAMARIMAKVIK